MNPAAEVVDALEKAGVSAGLSGDGERVVLSPASKAPSDLVEQVKEHKASVLVLVRERRYEKLGQAQLAIENSARLQEVARICSKGIFDREHKKTGAQAYKEGSAGILAGALAAHFSQTKPTSWRSWLGEARVVLGTTEGVGEVLREGIEEHLDLSILEADRKTEKEERQKISLALPSG